MQRHVAWRGCKVLAEKTMMGYVGFEGLSIQCILGVDEEERQAPQQIIVDVKALTDFQACVLSDHIEDAVDYTALASTVEELAVNNGYHLLETLASEAVEAILARFPVEEVSIKIHKPLSVARAKRSFVELNRKKK